MPLVWLQITSNWEQLLFQANLYFLLHAALSSASHWHSKRPLALAPRCSAASKIITLKVGQRELEMERSACCASHIVRLLRLNLLTFISAAHLIWIQCFTEPSVFPSSAAVVFSVALIHHCNNKKKKKEKKEKSNSCFDCDGAEEFSYQCCTHCSLCSLSVKSTEWSVGWYLRKLDFLGKSSLHAGFDVAASVQM